MKVEVRKIVLLIILGLALGIASSFTDLLEFGSFLFILGGFLNTASVWSLSAFIVGTQFKSRKKAVLYSILFLSLSVTAYYSFGFLIGDRQEIPLLIIISTAFSWVIISIFIGTLCGLAGTTAKHSKTIRKKIVSVLIPVIIILSETLIALAQLYPYLSNPENLIPFGILITLLIFGLILPYSVFKDKKVAFYTMGLSIILSLFIVFILVSLSQL